MIAPAPTTVAPAAAAHAMVSRVDNPVVTTSSMTTTRSMGESVNPRRSVSAPSCRSAKMAPDAKRARHFVADDQAAERRREHHRRPQFAQGVAERAAKLLGMLRVLQDKGGLQVTAAMEPARQTEMSFEQGANGAKKVQNS